MEITVWDSLHKAMTQLEKSEFSPDGIILHKLDAKFYWFLPRYQRLNYPLGKNKKGFNKWFNREWRNIKKEGS